jgi:hypothetical protein
MTAVSRVLSKDLAEMSDILELDLAAGLERIIEEKESPSYPGVWSRYDTIIVQASISSCATNTELLRFGLPRCTFTAHGTFMVTSTADVAITCSWFDPDQCRGAQICTVGKALSPADLQEMAGGGSPQDDEKRSASYPKQSSTQKKQPPQAKISGLTKTVKMMEEPSAEELLLQLHELQKMVNPLVSHKGEVDLSLETDSLSQSHLRAWRLQASMTTSPKSHSFSKRCA